MPKTRAPAEFIVMIALMISLVAMTTDIVLPALTQIATDLGQSDPNRGHLVISTLFAGFAVGQLIVGPLSDAWGRRRVIHISYIIFSIGCILCLWAPGFEMLLLSRFLQGIGMSGPRIVAVAIVRDGFEGRAMARIMSFVMGVFILVPAIAPAIGQGVIFLWDWRATFWLLLVMALITWVWFGLRQTETLRPQDRRPLSIQALWSGILTILRSRAALGYTLSAGMIFGPFLAYLSLAQQIFQDSYQIGAMFAFWFGTAALSIGAASFVNSALVERLGMRYLSNLSLICVVGLSLMMGSCALLWSGLPPFWLFILWLLSNFFCMGLLWGNLNALAMEPLGKIAGLGAAVVGALSTFLAIPVSSLLNARFDGSVSPLIIGFGLAALICLGIGRWANAAGQSTSG